MIKEGDEKVAKYWGNFKVKKVVRLKNPVKCYSHEIGEALFNPTLVKIEWEHSPSEDKNEFWFPYWISVRGKERYGQYAPMMGEHSLLELLTSAIKQGFFSDDFLCQLDQLVRDKLTSTPKAS
jgi:hypothetical protein